MEEMEQQDDFFQRIEDELQWQADEEDHQEVSQCSQPGHPEEPQMDHDAEASPPSSEHQTTGGTSGALGGDRPTNLIFVDGSLSSSDRRFRRAGWAVVKLTTDDYAEASTANIHEAWHGDVDGKQTAATGELAAFWHALTLTTGDATIVTDCALVANGWPKREQLAAAPGTHTGWWQRISTAAAQRRGQVAVEKCFSHLDDQTAQELEQPALWTVGNEFADSMAQAAAKEAAAPMEETASRCRDVDRMAQHIHKRIAAIHMEACEATAARPLPPRGPAIKTSTILDAERTSGHHMRRRHQNGLWQCGLCGCGPGRGSLLDWLRSRPCTGKPNPDDQESQLAQMIRLRYGTDARVDQSHELRMTGRVLWCECCGQYSDVQLKGLAKPCRAPRKKGLCNVARLEKGLHPKVGRSVDWCTDEGLVTLVQPPQRVATAAEPRVRHRS